MSLNMVIGHFRPWIKKVSSNVENLMGYLVFTRSYIKLTQCKLNTDCLNKIGILSEVLLRPLSEQLFHNYRAGALLNV